MGTLWNAANKGGPWPWVPEARDQKEILRAKGSKDSPQP